MFLRSPVATKRAMSIRFDNITYAISSALKRKHRGILRIQNRQK